MLPDPGPRFEREYGCFEHEWLAWLPAAAHGHGFTLVGPGTGEVAIGQGKLLLSWQVLPLRVIALLRLPRLAVRFSYDNVTDDERRAFQRGFDMRMQRGGG